MGKLRAAAAELGWANALLYGMDRAFVKLGLPARINRCRYVAQRVAEAPMLPAGRGRSIEVRQLATDDPILERLPLTAEIRASRHRDPRIVCFGAFKGEAFLGCHWLTLGPHDDEQFRAQFVPLPEGRAVWDFDIFLFPEYRSGLAFSRLWDEVFAFLRARGVGWSMSYISTFNPASIAAHRTMGSRPVGAGLFIELGRVQLLFATVAPFVHLSPGPASRPVIKLPPPR